MEKTKTSTTAIARISAAGVCLCVAFTVAFSGVASADSSKLDAKLAIERAQASIDMVSKENAGVTQEPSFALAHQKITDAQAALDHQDNRQAIWLAEEAELQADTTAGAVKLAALEHARSGVAHDVQVLDLELSK